MMDMDVFWAYTHGTAAWLALQALPLITTPKLVITLLAKDYHVTSDIEIYFCRSLGFALAMTAITSLFFTGSIPLSSTIGERLNNSEDARAPYAVPIVAVTTVFHGVSLLYIYVCYMNSGQIGYLMGAVGYGCMSAMGLWCVIFGMGTGRLSKRTGADKRTTGFPFKNAAAYDKKRDKKQI